NDQLRSNIFTAGLQAGFNHQTGAWVFGLEADANYFRTRARFSSTILNAFSGNSYTFTSSLDTDWLVTVRPRIGYAFDRLLVYATGGLAVSNQRFSQNIVQLNTDFTDFGSVSKTTVGWTAGAGVEYALGTGVSLKAEYLYVDLGSVAFASAGFCPIDPT